MTITEMDVEDEGFARKRAEIIKALDAMDRAGRKRRPSPAQPSYTSTAIFCALAGASILSAVWYYFGG